MEKTNKMFTLEGSIQAARKTAGTLNLVEHIQKGTLFTGLAAGLSEQGGMLANAASLALYEGEDVEHIALLINDKLAIGTFQSLDELMINDEVKLVVSELEDGPLYIHAILRCSDQLLWTPYSIDHTRQGWIMHGVKLSTAIVVGTWLLFGTYFILRSDPFPTQRDLIYLGIGPIIMMLFVGFMSTSGMSHLGQEAEDIFEALGVPRFRKFRIKPYSLMMDFSIKNMPLREHKGHIFKFSEAMAAHKKKYRLD